MVIGGKLVAGLHNRNEFIYVNVDDIGKGKSVKELRGEKCEICGDEVEITTKGELFVACNGCAFPVCRNCYEYERREGSQSCPHCKTRYNRTKGCPRVEGDEDEGDVDDLENGSGYYHGQQHTKQELSPRLKIGRVHRSRADASSTIASSSLNPDVPQEVAVVSPEYHAIFIPPFVDSGSSVHLAPFPDSSSSLHPSSLDPLKDTSLYGYGSVAWKQRVEEWKKAQNNKLDFDNPDLPKMVEDRQPLSRQLTIPSRKIYPYRLIILIRLVLVGLFFHYRILHPVHEAFGLWLTSVICEIWFGVSWILDVLPKWYDKEGKSSELADVDVFVSTVDPLKEPPLVTANTVLSILAVDYPVDKVACYVSDDGASMLTFKALSETSEFARKWVPFCKRYNIEPRAPGWYFLQKIDYLKDKVNPTFVLEWRAIKREYEEFKIRINALGAMAEKVPEDGWKMQDGRPWPGNNVRDHRGMIQVFLGHSGVCDVEGNTLPRLVYVSREKRPGFNHQNKAGAMNALVRVSAVISNAPYLLNVDCDNYINNSKALREAMCFMMDPISGRNICYVQFPQRFYGIDRHDRYANRNVVFFDINMKGLDGIQGPISVGTGCVFRRQAFYGYDAPVTKKPPGKSCNCLRKWCCICFASKWKNGKIKPKEKKKKMILRVTSKQIHALECIEEGKDGLDDEKSHLNLEKRYGQSPVFIASTLLGSGGLAGDASSSSSFLKEAIHVISCGYEDKTEWGKEIGWIYGSLAVNILTGFKMHCHGWRSVYCMPKRPAFKGSAPINLSDRLHQVNRWALGSVEILFSKHCPIWYGYGRGLKLLQRFFYINSVVYPLTSIPLVAYCTLPAVCLITNKFIFPEISLNARLVFSPLYDAMVVTCILEMRWGRVEMEDWYTNVLFWLISGVSAHLFALFQGLLKILAGVNTDFTVPSKGADDGEHSELYPFKWTSLLLPPLTLLIINKIGFAIGILVAINNIGYGSYESWGLLFVKLFLAFWISIHLYPFLLGMMMGRRDKLPTTVIVWALLLSSILSLIWVRMNPSYDGNLSWVKLWKMSLIVPE